MIDLKLDQKGDLLISDYDLSLIEGQDQISQNLAIRLRFVLGEWYLDIESGIPYYQDIFIKSPNRNRIETIIKDEIVNTQGINRLLSFQSDYQPITRKYSVRFQCETDKGTLDQEVILL